jgi:hypothetical protein
MRLALSASALLLTLLLSPMSNAKLFGGLKESDASGGLKEALAKGVENSILKLGKQDGFNNDPLVRILVPEKIRKLADTARKLGAGKKVDQFELAMNRAAEQAVPEAASLFSDAVKQMSVQDAVGIIKGGDTAGTEYFRRVTQDKLRERFLPIVQKSTANNQVAQSYKSMVGKNSGVMKLLGADEQVDLDTYVTNKAMDGLYFYIAEEEKKIRKDPLARTSKLLKKVFGKL